MVLRLSHTFVVTPLPIPALMVVNAAPSSAPSSFSQEPSSGSSGYGTPLMLLQVIIGVLNGYRYVVAVTFNGANVVDGVNGDGKGKKLQEGSELNGKVNVVLLRTEEDLDQCDVLVIPGGETTTIAFLARLSGLLDPPKKLIKTKPARGTCARAILLSKVVMGAKKGGQEILGGMSVMITRNRWGPQFPISLSNPLKLHSKSPASNAEDPFSRIFIRTPVPLSLDQNQTPEYPPIQVIARLPETVIPHTIPSDAIEPLETSSENKLNLDEGENPQRALAICQDHHLLMTFHPELTRDNRFHASGPILPDVPSKPNHTPVIAGSVIAGTLVILSILLLLWRYKKKSRPHLPFTSGLAANSETARETTLQVEPYTLKHMSISYTSRVHPHSVIDGNEESTPLNSPRNSINATVVTTSALTERQIQLRDETEALREQMKILQRAVLSSNVERQREIAKMGAHIQRLESVWNSDWARGISDDPPPNYEY
ncbi:hypothetical protein K435DRAFT_973538 [Dendrothele bispora CBS 962.96]|uniref:Uncharacterized protein n=1 Tax=Dendrothele bispora (strain CBS 962.96) TaxID=1314807 RepID=A0A4S8KRN7_DENBC|nr:hypothetical protein K435DRAFT_973538 [Dendrothele bispora CBS 962.96]